MRTWITIQKPVVLAGLLLPVFFFLGFFIGAAVLPATALNQLYKGGQLFFQATLPVHTAVQDSPLPVNLLLAAAGMPITDFSSPGALPVTAGRDDTGDENILIIPAEPKPAEPLPQSDTPQAVVYCTHASEEYSGQQRINGQPGGVMAAARVLADELEAAGISVILDETVHDSPSYDAAYGSSLQTLTAYKEQYPEIELFIDVHRDSSIPGVSYTMRNDTGAYARMMLVIGSDENLEHPNWQQNLAFARQVHDAAEALQSGIMREPRIYSGRYNQHMGTQALLVEIGSTENSVEEAKRSAAVMGRAIVNCLKENAAT